MEVQIFLDNLKIVASSPYALVGYLTLVVAWVYVVTANRRLTIIGKLLLQLPRKDRLEILKKEYNTIPRAGLSAEQWIKSRKHLFLFFGFIALLLLCSVLFLAALSRTAPSGMATNHSSHKVSTNMSASNINTTAFFQGVEAKNISVNVKNSKIINNTGHASIPKFEIYVNGLRNPIAQHDIIPLSEDRQIRFRVKNVGEFVAENVSMSVFFPLKQNEIISDGWQIQAPPINPKTNQEVNGLLHLWSVSAGSVSEQSWYRAPLLSISTNLPSPSFSRRAMEQLGLGFEGSAKNCPQDFIFNLLPVIVSVHSDRSKNHQLLIFLKYSSAQVK
jgi:hypothetical protein